jgi:hypothetical protein
MVRRIDRISVDGQEDRRLRRWAAEWYPAFVILRFARFPLLRGRAFLSQHGTTKLLLCCLSPTAGEWGIGDFSRPFVGDLRDFLAPSCGRYVLARPITLVDLVAIPITPATNIFWFWQNAGFGPAVDSANNYSIPRGYGTGR